MLAKKVIFVYEMCLINDKPFPIPKINDPTLNKEVKMLVDIGVLKHINMATRVLELCRKWVFKVTKYAKHS